MLTYCRPLSSPPCPTYSKSRKGCRAASTAWCSAQVEESGEMVGISQRVLPITESCGYFVESASCCETYVKRRCSSCCQYQSDDSSVSARKRDSLSRKSSSTRLNSVMSRATPW